MEQGTTTFIQAAKELGPVVVLLLGIGGLGFWQLLKLYLDALERVRQVSDARVADILTGQQVMRDNTSAMQSLQTTGEAQNAAIDRLASRMDQLSLEVTRLKGG